MESVCFGKKNDIQSISNAENWRYVPLQLNPADRISRGILPSQILEDNLWWHGPNYLVQSVTQWPKNIISLSRIKEETKDEESRKIVSFSAVENSLINRYSDLGKLLRIAAYGLKFGRNSRIPRHTRIVGSLQPLEIDSALKSLIRSVQSEEFRAEIKYIAESPRRVLTSRDAKIKLLLKTCNLVLDDTGLLRILGRLVKMPDSLDSRAPILLPANHRLTHMIAWSVHLRTMHGGPTLLLATMRQRFWPIRGRELARKIVRQCVKCFKCSPKPTEQYMTPLP